MVLQQGGDDARQGQGAAVEGVDEFGLAVGVAEAALQAVGLVGLEVGHARDLQPTLLRRRPHFEVVRQGGGESEVASTQAQGAERQFELAEQTAHVLDHAIEGGIAVFRLLESDDFHLVELVQAIESAHVLAIGTGFTTEAGGVATELDGQLIGLQQVAAEEVGQGNLRRRDQVEIVLRAVVHLAFLVGQLTGAAPGIGIDHMGRNELLVSGGVRAVEEELDERRAEAWLPCPGRLGIRRR